MHRGHGPCKPHGVKESKVPAPQLLCSCGQPGSLTAGELGLRRATLSRARGLVLTTRHTALMFREQSSRPRNKDCEAGPHWQV